MTSPKDLYVPKVLARDGLAKYEPDSLAAALAIVEAREGVFVDVGANVGVFALVVAGVTGRASLAFEPLPAAAEVLEATVRRHRLDVAVSRVALADRDGITEFFVSATTDSSSGLDEKFRPVSARFPVTLARLDDVLGTRAPSLIKIDTETTEPAVLAGSVATIERHRPPFLVEVLYRRTEDAIQAFFTERGYAAYHVTSADRWEAADRVTGDPKYAFNNWLFTPEPLDDAFFTALMRWRIALRDC
jgi:FkbM family methyltransferase